jgi:hypothetical protein
MLMGYLTFQEATNWYRNGNGGALNVDLSKISLTGVYVSDFQGVGSKISVNLLMKVSPLDMMLNDKAWNDAKVYGNITLKLYPNNEVRAYQDEYNFEMHPWGNPLNWIRNAETWVGSSVAGDGQSYKININGGAFIPTAPLPIK